MSTTDQTSVAPTAMSWSPISSQLAVDEHALVRDRGVERRVGEQAEQQRADDPADEVHADDVERVVVAELELDAAPRRSRSRRR